MKKIYLLHGREAVSCYNDNGVKECLEKGYFNISEIAYDANQPIEVLINNVLWACNSKLDNCFISKDDFSRLKEHPEPF